MQLRWEVVIYPLIHDLGLCEKALSSNMPKDNIDRAIKKGSGANDSSSFENITYEGYGLDGVAVMINCLTDNKIRTVADIRHIFSKNGGNLGTLVRFRIYLNIVG